MMAVMGVSIYTTRVYLDQLGVSDYGIYNIVGGVVGMLTFFFKLNVNNHDAIHYSSSW